MFLETFYFVEQIEELETKNKAHEKEFELYKEQQSAKPEVRLQSEINVITLEKVLIFSIFFFISLEIRLIKIPGTLTIGDSNQIRFIVPDYS